MLSLAKLEPSLVLCVAPASFGLGGRGQDAEEVASCFHRVHSSSNQESGGGHEESSAPQKPCVEVFNNIDKALQRAERWVHLCHVESATEDGDSNDLNRNSRVQGDQVPLVCVTGSNYIVGAAMRSLQISL